MSSCLSYFKLMPVGNKAFLVLIILLYYKIYDTRNLIIKTDFISFIKKLAIFSPEKRCNKFQAILYQFLIP